MNKEIQISKPNIVKITTKTGDKGQTSLFGGSRVDKDHPRIEATGALDELNAAIGLLTACLPENDQRREILGSIQQSIMQVMSHVATPLCCPKVNPTPMPTDMPHQLEILTQAMLDDLGDKANFFVLPGGDEISARAHWVRTVTRQAERRLVTLNKEEAVAETIMMFINRLSDFFFAFSLHHAWQNNLELRVYKRFKS